MVSDTIPQSAEANNGLTAEYLRSVLDYDHLTGVFRWRARSDVRILAWNTRWAGKVAGSSLNGYRIIKINGVTYYAHRLAFIYMTGRIPIEVDHKNRKRSDNWWKNLREATVSQNGYNKPKLSCNVSGLKGVYFKSQRQKWISRISADKRRIHLGCFDTREAAYEAYCEAAHRLHGEFASTE